MHVADPLHQTTLRKEPEDGQIIWHALGLDYAMKPYRKHYVAPEAGPIRERCERMVMAGWLVRCGEPDRHGMQCYHVTRSGAALVGATL